MKIVDFPAPARAVPQPPSLPGGRRLSPREAARLLGVGRATVYKLVKAGEIACIRRPGGAIRITEAALAEYENKNTWPAHDSNDPNQGSSASTDGAPGISAGPRPEQDAARSAARALRTRNRMANLARRP